MGFLQDDRHWNRFETPRLMGLFTQLFFQSHHTLLLPTNSEPRYEPGGQPGGLHKIYFAHGYFQSALHELAHWCIAGPKRRELVDYGYWYEPDGRSADRQEAFFQVEGKVQGLEWLFTSAAKKTFCCSLDNLGQTLPESLVAGFAQAVKACALEWWEKGLPPRAETLLHALWDLYQSKEAFHSYWQDRAREGFIN